MEKDTANAKRAADPYNLSGNSSQPLPKQMNSYLFPSEYPQDAVDNYTQQQYPNEAYQRQGTGSRQQVTYGIRNKKEEGVGSLLAHPLDPAEP
jgi:hypothetical protein